jgi:hypothetical protein
VRPLIVLHAVGTQQPSCGKACPGSRGHSTGLAHRQHYTWASVKPTGLVRGCSDCFLGRQRSPSSAAWEKHRQCPVQHMPYGGLESPRVPRSCGITLGVGLRRGSQEESGPWLGEMGASQAHSPSHPGHTGQLCSVTRCRVPCFDNPPRYSSYLGTHGVEEIG